ncbi:MAG: NAD(P)-dependent oxidoreductase [Caldilineaceae bacterium SB0675_bin_29]|uniref:NAD(P)-dependent oxidoreductase n=1 Tax=Caldilineaceae bacterium SB0675_bin_29 TaxID=2605266 RepID=A0A6B1FZR5_9CHLR|nr:NAD(P)-dependent oxidoreductase [Caldilineaceae bacterium SB0675_bin_29]
MSKVLVTGGSGTIGGYVLRELLQAGHSATSFSRSAPHVEGAGFVQGDIMQPEQTAEACRGHDAVIHLAAIPGPGRATPAQLLNVNVIGTANVLEAAVHAGIGKVVFASSGAATGFSFQKQEIVPRYLPIDEEHPCEPQDEYGLSKLLGELTCKRYTDAFGIRTICLRINNNWYLERAGAEVAVGSGWAQQFTVEELLTKRYRNTIEDAEGEWPSPGPPAPHKILWAFTDARDAAQAFRLALENDTIRHEVFLINGDDTCSKEPTPLLIDRLRSSFGEGEAEATAPDILLKEPLERHASLWSHAKATRLLGYRPQFTWRQSDFQSWMEKP